MFFCCHRSLVCAVDSLLHSRGWTVQWICDAHDRHIMRDFIHCGDDTCADDHG